MPTRKRKDSTKVADEFGVQLVRTPTSVFGEVVSVDPHPEFQLEFQYSINPRQAISDVGGTGSVASVDAMAELKTGASVSSFAEIRSGREIKYRAGQSTLTRFTALFTIGIVGSSQIIGYGDDDDGLFFGYIDDEFGVIQRKGGVDNFIVQSDWNIDKFNGEGRSGILLDTTKGNSFQIEFQIFGVADFSIENPETGVFDKVHRISYPNTQLTPILNASTLPLFIKVENTTNTSDMTLKSASIAGLNQGIVFNQRGVLNSAGNKVIDIITEVPIFSLRNKDTFQSKTNRVDIVFQLATFSTFGAEPVIFRAKINGTLTGDVFVDVSTTTSVIAVDKVATAISGGLTVIQFDLAANDSLNLNVLDLNISLPPDTDFTLTAESSKKNTVSASATWRELF